MQKHSYYLCKYFARKKIFVTLVHTADKIDDDVRDINCFSDEEKAYITSIIVEKPRVPRFPGHYLRQAYLYSKAVYGAIAGIPPVDFIIAKGMTSWYLLGDNRRRAPVGINIHGYEYLQKKADFKSRLEGIVLSYPLTYINRKADYIFSYGGKITDHILSLGIGKERIIEATAAIEEEWMAEPPVDRGASRTFVFLGRYERRKGIQELTEVISRAAINHAFTFHFIGPVPAKKQLDLPNVHYHGTIKEKEKIQALLQRSHVLICPSYSEGMPNVILEAMGNGCAVIATDVGAVSLLVNQHTGWLIQPASIPDLEAALTNALTISREKLLQKQLSAFNMIRQEFLWENVSCKLIGRINAVLENGK